MPRPRSWTQSEDDLLKENWLKLDDKMLSKLIGKLMIAVKRRRHLLGLLRFHRKAWSDDEDKFIIDNWHGLSDDEIAKRLNRTASSIKNRRTRALRLITRCPNKAFNNHEIEFVKAHWQSMSDEATAKVLRCKPKRVEALRWKLRLLHRYSDGRVRGVLTFPKYVSKEELERYYLIYNLPIKEISKLIGFSKSQIWRWLKQYGIPLRRQKRDGITVKNIIKKNLQKQRAR